MAPAALAWRAGSPDLATAAAAVERLVGAFCTAATCDAVADACAQAVVARVHETLAVPVDEDRGWGLRALAADVRAVQPARGAGPRPFQKARKEFAEAVEVAAAAALDEVGRGFVAAPLARLLAVVDGVYDGAKGERGALDFTDLELRTLRLLEDLGARGRRIAQAPAALLVDEYQDTNPLQARLLAALRGMGSPQFSVGDPKQSIYRFRRADVRVIGAEDRRVGEAGRHVLQATFRARPELVDCLNGLHAPLFAHGAAGADHVPLRAEGRFRTVPGPDLELVVLDAGAGASADERRAAEAHWIATWIRDLVGRRVPRAKIETDGRGEERPPRSLSFGDVAILLRARTSLTVVEDALAALEIPFHTHKGRGFFQTEEIVDLVHALRVIHDPADDHAFACLATGPIVGATDADLLGLFPDPAAGRASPGTAWSRFVAGAGERHAVARFAEVARIVDGLRREALAGRLGRVVEGVLYDLGLLEAALLQPDGARRGANLRKAVAVARQMERSGREGLDDLLRRLETLRDREIAESEAALGREGEDVVRINTVHGAKGLEYPVVILADVGRRPGGGRDAIRVDGEGAFAARLRHPLEGEGATPAGFRALAEEEQAREEEESRRLLYVGTTRAEERLLLVGSCAGHKRDGDPKELYGWGPWLIDACGRRPEADPAEIPYGRGRAVVRLVSPLAAPRRPAPPPRGGAPSADACRAADALLAAARERVAPLGDTPFAVTVSELLEFAASPSRHHARGLEPKGLPDLRSAAEPDDPVAYAPGAEDQDARRAERARLWDEDPPPEPEGAGGRAGAPGGPGGDDGAGGEGAVAGAAPLDRAALGRALHALLETLEPGAGAASPEALERVLAAELGVHPPAAATRLLEAMVARYAASGTGAAVSRALEAGLDVRREVAFHARIRFPSGASVGGFDSLLVRGSIDLWLPDAAGRIHVVDHKTNPPGARLATPAAVAAHYAWQLRLYALAAERLRGEDVAGAHLLLLDPGWGPDAVQVDVDVSGPALEETRRLCRAYAVAALEGRWPASWEDLLGSTP